MIQKKDRVSLCDLAYMNVVEINGVRGNLSLATYVIVVTADNTTTVSYAVSSSVSSHEHIRKEFIDYDLAFDYYVDIHTKYGLK